MKVIKRFIAGAVCPKCAAMDKLVMYKVEDRQFRECVSCGFEDEMRLHQVGREPETRVNRTEEERAAEVQVVKLVDPGEANE